MVWASRSTATACAGRTGSSASASIRTRASCCTTRLRRRRRRRRSAPRLDRRDGRPVRRPEPDARFKNVFDTGEYGLGPLTTRSRSAATASARSSTSTRTINEHRRPVRDPERDLHARRGLRHALEDTRPLGRVDRAPPRRLVVSSSHRRQLRVRLLLVPLPGRHHPARGEAHGHRVDDAPAGCRTSARRSRADRPGLR